VTELPEANWIAIARVFAAVHARRAAAEAAAAEAQARAPPARKATSSRRARKGNTASAVTSGSQT
jgi:hypothetical protein